LKQVNVKLILASVFAQSSFLPRIKYGVNFSRNPEAFLVIAGNDTNSWIPAFAGMTSCRGLLQESSHGHLSSNFALPEGDGFPLSREGNLNSNI